MGLCFSNIRSGTVYFQSTHTHVIPSNHGSFDLADGFIEKNYGRMTAVHILSISRDGSRVSGSWREFESLFLTVYVTFPLSVIRHLNRHRVSFNTCM